MNLAYSVTLFLHSYVRWAVLALALGVLARTFLGWRGSRAWSNVDERIQRAFVGTLHVQFTLGIVLYLVLSPISAAFFADPGAAMKVRELRFFGVEHVTLMIVAVAVATAGRMRMKKRTDGAQKHRTACLSAAGALVLMCAAVPWPFLHVKRPLARTLTLSTNTSAAASGAACPPVYESRCAACHGKGGHADGPLAASLTPRPRTFKGEAWQAARTDAELESVIQEGGAAAGLSPLMPPHRDLRPEEVKYLVRCVRSFR